MAKVIARRWWVFLPFALVTALLTAQAGSRIAPEYQTTASVLLVGPFETVPQVEDQVVRSINPYLAQGISTTANVMKVVLESQESRQKIVQRGGSGAYSIRVQARTPIVNISVATANRELTLKTASAVSSLMREELQARQDAFKSPRQSHITTQTLDAIGSISVVRNGLKQIRVVIIALGLGLAVAASVFANGLLEWNRRRWSAKARAAADAGVSVDKMHRSSPVS